MNDHGTPSPTAWQRICEAWDRIWYPDGSATNLALFRILFAVALALEVSTTESKSPFAMVGGFHVPYVSFITPVSKALYSAMHNWQYPLIALLLVGVLTRPAIALLIVLQGYIFFADQLNFRNHPYVFILVLVFLLFSPCDRALSLRSWFSKIFRRKDGKPPLTGQTFILTGQQLIKFQICIVYLFAGFHKLSPEYLSGRVMADMMPRSIMSGLSGLTLTSWFGPETLTWIRELAAEPGTWVLISWVTAVLELGLPIALWMPRVRGWAMLAGLPFHVGIALLMDIFTFSLAMMGSYILFLDQQTIPKWWNRLRKNQTRTKSAAPLRKKKPIRR